MGTGDAGVHDPDSDYLCVGVYHVFKSKAAENAVAPDPAFCGQCLWDFSDASVVYAGSGGIDRGCQDGQRRGIKDYDKGCPAHV